MTKSQEPIAKKFTSGRLFFYILTILIFILANIPASHALDSKSKSQFGTYYKEYLSYNAIEQRTSKAVGTQRTYFYYTNDALGTPQQLVNSNDTVSWKAKYSAFGKADISTNSVSNPMRFPGQYADEESGLHQNYYRDYDPTIGGYTTVDPYGVTVTGFNRYHYAGGNPLTISDSTGEIPFLIPIGAALLVANVAYTGYQFLECSNHLSNPCAYPDGEVCGNAMLGAALSVIPGGVLWRSTVPVFRRVTAVAPYLKGLAKGARWNWALRGVRSAGDVAKTNSAFQRMLKAGEAVDRGGLSKAGRGLQKHGSRTGSVFPSATGNPAAINQQGQHVLQDILNSQNQLTKPNRFGGSDIYDAITGRGVRYDGSGNMMGFLEP